MSRQPNVGVVICNWNKRDFVLNCIKSVKQSLYDNLEIIVVDNASSDGSAEAIKIKYPGITLIENRVNLGGAGGFNTGLRYGLERGRFKYLYCLDNDVVISPTAIGSLVEAMETDESIAFTGSKIMIMDEPNRLQELGAFVDWSKFRISLYKAGRFDNRPPPIEDTFVHYVPACSLMARVNVLEKIGIMDSSYFIYFDDIDWATRAILAGYKIKAIASSRVWHKRGGFLKTSNQPAYYWCRNEGYFFNKYTSAKRWETGMRKWMQSYFKAMTSCEIYGKKNTGKVFKQALIDLAEDRRGKADWFDFPEVECGTYMTPSEVFNGMRIHILGRAFTGPVHHMLKHLSSPKMIKAWNPGKPFDADVLVIPVDHVFNGRTDHKFPGIELYWVDGFSNILPLGIEGDRILKRSSEIMENHRSYFEPKIMEGLAGIRAATPSIKDQKLQGLSSLGWDRDKRWVIAQKKRKARYRVKKESS